MTKFMSNSMCVSGVTFGTSPYLLPVSQDPLHQSVYTLTTRQFQESLLDFSKFVEMLRIYSHMILSRFGYQGSRSDISLKIISLDNVPSSQLSQVPTLMVNASLYEPFYTDTDGDHIIGDSLNFDSDYFDYIVNRYIESQQLGGLEYNRQYLQDLKVIDPIDCEGLPPDPELDVVRVVTLFTHGDSLMFHYR